MRTGILAYFNVMGFIITLLTLGCSTKRSKLRRPQAEAKRQKTEEGFVARPGQEGHEMHWLGTLYIGALGYSPIISNPMITKL